MIWQVHENTTLVKNPLIWSKLMSRGQSLFSNAKGWLLELHHQHEATYPVEQHIKESTLQVQQKYGTRLSCLFQA